MLLQVHGEMQLAEIWFALAPIDILESLLGKMRVIGVPVLTLAW